MTILEICVYLLLWFVVSLFIADIICDFAGFDLDDIPITAFGWYKYTNLNMVGAVFISIIVPILMFPIFLPTLIYRLFTL